MSDDLPKYVTEGVRGHWVWDSKLGKCVEREPEKPKEVNAPMVITDEMKAADLGGKWYTSKAAFRRAARARGLVECYGESDKAWQKPDTTEQDIADATDDVLKAYELLKNNEAPLTEDERELCRMKDKTLPQEN